MSDAETDASKPQSEGARLMAEANELALLARAKIKLELARKEMLRAAFMKERNDRAEATAAAKRADAKRPRSSLSPRFG